MKMIITGKEITHNYNGYTVKKILTQQWYGGRFTKMYGYFIFSVTGENVGVGYSLKEANQYIDKFLKK